MNPGGMNPGEMKPEKETTAAMVVRHLFAAAECRYHRVTEQWTDERLHELYQADFLRFFGLSEYIDEEVETRICAWYNQLIAMPGVRATLVALGYYWHTDDPAIGMAMLFSFPYLHRTFRLLTVWKRSGRWPAEEWSAFHEDVVEATRERGEHEDLPSCIDARGILRDVDLPAEHEHDDDDDDDDDDEHKEEVAEEDKEGKETRT